ncbi:MAG: metallophosphoesterase [Bdellovibrionales bacterium]|nr:metallophosphoesterase [Bdellovibrionales bacterium]
MIPTLLLATTYTYLSLSLFGPWYASDRNAFYLGSALLLLIFSGQAWLFFVFFRSAADANLRFERPLQKFAFAGMGVISFLFTFTILRDLGGILLAWSGSSKEALYSNSAIATILLLSLACLIWGSLSARFKITTPKIRIQIPELPTELEGLRIVQLSDLHLGTGPDLVHIRSIMDKALKLSPDVIVLTGDIIDGAPSLLSAELEELSRLKARLGVYFVLGNHECYWVAEKSIEAIRRIGFTPLLNEGVTLELSGKKIFIGGVTDPAAKYFNGEGPRIPDPDLTSSLRILLAHQPQIAKQAALHPYHLQLSGHTHGGQFFPWNWVVRGIYLHPGGLGRIQDLQVYVSHGTGFWGPPLRLGTNGEITTLEMIRMSS